MRWTYTAEFRLFRDDPNAITTGRYFFALPDTPFYDGFHLLGSSTWDDKNHPNVSTLGEIRNGRPLRTNGEGPATNVINRRIGLSTCIENGESIANALDETTAIDGYPIGCVITQDELDALWAEVSSFDLCSTQRVYAAILVAMYAKDETQINDLIGDWLGPAVTVVFRPHGNTLNGLVTITTAQWQVAITDGTQTFTEFAMQAFSFIQAPVDVGGFSTSQFWMTAALFTMQRMQLDGLDDTMKVMFVGHSYGAAVASINVARAKRWNPAGEFKFLTYGIPKIGDARLVDLIASNEGVHICTDADLVTILPPDRITLAPVLPLIALPALLVYTEWERARPQLMIRSDGTAIAGGSPFMDSETLFNLIVNAIAGFPVDPFSAHYMTNYWDQLTRRCPDVAWPIDELVSFKATLPDNAIRFNGRPALKGTSIVFKHPPYLIPPTPGLTCADALLLNLDEPVSGSITTTVENWFKVARPPGPDFQLRITGVNRLSVLALEGVSCPDSFYYGAFFKDTSGPLVIPLVDYLGDFFFLGVGYYFDPSADFVIVYEPA